MGDSHEHIVMLPLMAQGHLIPFLALARQIHQRTNFAITITIATTPINADQLRSAIVADPPSSSTDQPPHVRVAVLPFNSSNHGLPPNSENTDSLNFDQIITLFHASTALEAPFRQLIEEITVEEGRPPICIISDTYQGWATRVADSTGTVNVGFCTSGAYGTAAYVSVWQNLPHRCTEADEFSVPGFPDSFRVHRSQLSGILSEADGNDRWSRFFQPQISLSLRSFGWLCNTAEEMEGLGLEILRKYIKLPVWTIGPLLPPSMLSTSSSSSSSSRSDTLSRGRESGISPQKCLEWLDSQPQSSVLYISFGSMNTISASQMMELAEGLENSGKPFIWVIRPPMGFDLKGEFRAEWLPDGFEERTTERKRGLLVRSWAPQLEILRHQSTAAFLSHCGWNSVMESLSQGVPMIGWPLAAEQAYNSKMLVEEIEVCVEMTRGKQSIFTAAEVERVIDLAMEKNGKGEEMRIKAVEIGKLLKAAVREEGGQKGSSLQAMDHFVSAILSAAKTR